MRWLAVVVLVVCSAVASCGGGDRPPPQRPSAGCAQRLPLETFLRVPDGPRRPRVLLLALHGARQSGPDLQRYSGLTSAAGNVIVAYPQSPHDDGFWRVSDVSRLLALVRAIGRCVPVARVAAVGFSNGGLMANALACRAARRVRAIVLVSAGSRRRQPAHHRFRGLAQIEAVRDREPAPTGRGLVYRASPVPAEARAVRPDAGSGRRNATQLPNRRGKERNLRIFAQRRRTQSSACLQGFRRRSRDSIARLKIVVSPVRVRVSPSPAMPDGCWISGFPACWMRFSIWAWDRPIWAWPGC